MEETTPTQDEVSEVVEQVEVKKRTTIKLGREVALCEGELKEGRLCGRVAQGGRRFCRFHGPENVTQRTEARAITNAPYVQFADIRPVALPQDLKREYEALKKMLMEVTKTVTDPKALNRINDLIVAVKNLDEKFHSYVSREQMRQLGFYFGSILFTYIPDGERYQRARKDMIDAVMKSNLYDKTELREVFGDD